MASNLHTDTLELSPRESFSDTLYSFEAPSSGKTSPKIPIKLSLPEPSYPSLSSRSDADEETLVGDTRTFISTPTPITPIQPNPSINFRVPKTSGANRRKTMLLECILTIVFCTIITLGIGAVFGVSNFSIGCLTRKSSMKTCKKLGAAGGTFASIPAAVLTFLTWYIHKILSKRNLPRWVFICMFLVIPPSICFGFTFLTAFTGWHILNSTGSVDFDLHRAFIFAAIGSASTFILYSFAFVYLIFKADA